MNPGEIRPRAPAPRSGLGTGGASATESLGGFGASHREIWGIISLFPVFFPFSPKLLIGSWHSDG